MKIVDFSETIAACDLKVGRCRQLIELMKECEYSRSRSYLNFSPRSLYPRHLCRGVYSFCLSVRLLVCSFVCLYFYHVCRICVKILHQSFSSGVYLSNCLLESIHIWTIVTLEGWHSLNDPGPQGGARGQNLGHL